MTGLSPGEDVQGTPVRLTAAFIGALGAALLFVAQPAAAKAILPRMGGGPAAWGATLLFFQLILILGYGTVDWALRTGGPRRVRTAHLTLLLSVATLLVLTGAPFAVPAPPRPATFATALWLLASQLGLPVLALALTAPAVQVRLLNATGEGDRSVYGLYAASNAGSLIGLLAYPWIVEPRVPLSVQWTTWRGGLWLFTGLVVALWLSAGLRGRRRVAPDAAPPPVRERLTWMVRAAIPAALLAGVTEYATRDIAPIPLLWVLPLALYLATWIIGFSPRARRLVRLAGSIQDAAAIVALVLFLNQPFALIGPGLALVALAIIGITQHGALAASAPQAAWLGRFYVLLAIGGAAGTALVVLIGPTLFALPIETPVALVAAIAVGPPARTVWTRMGGRIFLGLSVVALAIPFINGFTRSALLGSVSIAAGVLAMRWRARPKRVAAGLLALVSLYGAITLSAPDLVGGDHGILGRFAVYRDSQGTRLISGSTLHGLEPPDASAGRPEPALYYARHGPYGDLVSLMKNRGSGWRFGVVGLGIGSLACTAPPGTAMTFFELNPGVLRIAADTSLFRSLAECAPTAIVHLGDARLTLEQFGREYDILTLDAFSSDAIPTHLLTREAFALYRAHLAPGGVIAFHVSNRFLDLAPVVAALAREPGWVAAEALPVRRQVPGGVRAPEPSIITLIALAADSASLRPLVATGQWQWLHPVAAPWSDDWSPLASALSLSRGNVLGR